MSLLYLTQQGTKLQKGQGRFIVRSSTTSDLAFSQSAESSVEVPIREIEQVLIFGNIHLTTAAIATCLHHQSPVVFLSQTGSYKGHLWSAESHHPRSEKAQYQRLGDARWQMTVARTIVSGKLWNSKQLLLKLNRRRNLAGVDAAIAGIKRDLRAVQASLALASAESSAADLAQLRGYEGIAAARYFPALGQLITNTAFTFERRTRRPPTDPVNSLLSFGYTLLFNNVLSLLRVEGLNPYLGNLHRSERHEAQLAFDLMEEFRSPVVDTLVLKLINQQAIDPDDFTSPNAAGGVYLTEAARRRFLQQFEGRMMLAVRHPDTAESVPYRQAIQLQVRRYKQSLLEDVPYEAFRRLT
ncbi:MAG: CRISPR-associated endonuclease Cas1 [Elainellaceae cyanobacterium]